MDIVVIVVLYRRCSRPLCSRCMVVVVIVLLVICHHRHRRAIPRYSRPRCSGRRTCYYYYYYYYLFRQRKCDIT